MNKAFSFIIGLTFLSACSLQTDRIPSAEIVEKIKSVQEIRKSVDLKLTQTKITPKTFKIKILLSNPEEKEITSTRTWLSYNPEDLKIVKIDMQNSDFNLAAPGEAQWDQERGIIKIGRSNTNETVKLVEIQVAEITVEKIQTGSTIIDFYNYHENQSGHTNVNMMLNGKIYNLAKKPATPALVLE